MTRKYDEFVEELRKRQFEIADVRDKLRQTIDEAESLDGDLTEAKENLEQAIDALSRLQ